MKTSSISAKMNKRLLKKALWLDDQYEDLMDFLAPFTRINYLVDSVGTVSETLEKLQKEEYDIYIFDLKVFPGNDPEWVALDDKKREENPHVDTYLGLELLRFLDKHRKEKTDLWKEIRFDFKKVFVFSVVNDKKIYDELESFGIPPRQIVYKSGIDLDTLPKLVMEIEHEK